MAMLEDFGTYLQSKGYGTVGTNIFLDHMPTAPEQVISLYGVPGFPPIEHMGNPLPSIEGLRCEVQVRAISHAIAENLSRDIWGDMHRLVQVQYNDGLYHRVWSLNSPYLEERDSSRSWIFTCTYNVMRKVVGS